MTPKTPRERDEYERAMQYIESLADGGDLFITSDVTDGFIAGRESLREEFAVLEEEYALLKKTLSVAAEIIKQTDRFVDAQPHHDAFLASANNISKLLASLKWGSE